MAERLTIRRDRMPSAVVGDTVTVSVRALVTKIETAVYDVSGYSAQGEPAYQPGETTIDLLVMGVDDGDGP